MSQEDHPDCCAAAGEGDCITVYTKKPGREITAIAPRSCFSFAQIQILVCSGFARGTGGCVRLCKVPLRRARHSAAFWPDTALHRITAVGSTRSQNTKLRLL
jgi:hypothetical protein